MASRTHSSACVPNSDSSTNTGDSSDIAVIESGFHALSTDSVSRFEAFENAVFDYQKIHNPVYRRFVGSRYLPIEAFRLAPVATFPVQEAEAVFQSSGTRSGVTRSRHYVRKLEVYDRSARTNFRLCFGESPMTLIGHLPDYTQSGRASSLVHMVHMLIADSGSPHSCLFLEDIDTFRSAVERSVADQLPVVLFGAAFGLLDLVESYTCRLPPDAIVIETGGMKTHRRTVDRRSLHEILASGFGIDRTRIRSEYGMCELLSQCYTRGSEEFYPPPWVKFSIRDLNTATREVPDGETGVLAVSDLANMYSASFVLTEDRARRIADGFQVLGRIETAGLRGCNFLLEE